MTEREKPHYVADQCAAGHMDVYEQRMEREELAKLLINELKKIAKNVSLVHDAVTFEQDIRLTLTLEQANAIVDNAGSKAMQESCAPAWKPLKKTEYFCWFPGNSPVKATSIQAATTTAEETAKKYPAQDIFVLRVQRVVRGDVQISVKEIG